MLIRVTKEWKNGDTVWPEGQLLEVNDSDAAKIIKDGFAEEYEAKSTDIIDVSPATGDTGMTQEKLVELVTDIIAKQQKESKKALGLPDPDTEKYAETAGFVNMADFAQSVYKADAKRIMDERLHKWSNFAKQEGLNEGVGSEGGYLVPTEFRNTLLKNSLDASIVRPRATVIPMNTNAVGIPIVDESSRASSVYGGIIIYRPDEGGQKTKSKPKFGKIQLTLHKLVGLCYVTDELLEDSPVSVQPLLTTLFSEAIAYQEDDDFINGTGAGMSLGVMNAPCLVSQIIESGQPADTIRTENIVKMWSRMNPRSQSNAIWLAHNDTFPQLATLTLNVGTGGSNVGLISNINDAPNMKLLGRPLILTDHCQTVGDKGDIICADWRQYIIGQKAGRSLEVATSIHLRFDYDETAYRFVMRIDGQPWWKSALTPKRGSNTLSPFVTLDERA